MTPYEEIAHHIHQEYVMGTPSHETRIMMVFAFQKIHPELSLERCGHHLLVERLRIAKEKQP